MLKFYPEFSHLEQSEDPKNPFSAFFKDGAGNEFYIEPAFYTGLMTFKSQLPHEYPRIIEEMGEIVKRNHKVIFTIDDENPLTHTKGAILITPLDIADKLQIYLEDKSRGCDYGD